MVKGKLNIPGVPGEIKGQTKTARIKYMGGLLNDPPLPVKGLILYCTVYLALAMGLQVFCAQLVSQVKSYEHSLYYLKREVKKASVKLFTLYSVDCRVNVRNGKNVTNEKLC